MRANRLIIHVLVIYLTFNISLVIWLMRSFFENTPRALEEAAWIEGAGFWQGLLRIVLPTAVPGLAATAILGRVAPSFLRNRSDSAE